MIYFKLFLLALLLATNTYSSDEYLEARKSLLDEIQSDFRLTRSATGVNSLSDIVASAMLAVPRHKFVRPRDVKHAYENRPLRIGYGQTISQPYIVALMTDLLDLQKDDNVLEVGTGSGYQAAILATLVKSVYTIEIIEPLYKKATERISVLGYDNVKTRLGDGYYGWPKDAPFDAIIVTAAATHIPPPLVKQLQAGGKMVIPVGSQFFTQQLMLVEKKMDGSVTSRQILPVAFVPLTGTH